MARIIEHNTGAVTLGVINGTSFRLEPDLQTVTFVDHRDSVHTVHAHKEGPFGTPDEIVAAFEAGTLHAFASDEDAIGYFRQQGDSVTAERIGAREQRADDAETKMGGGQ